MSRGPKALEKLLALPRAKRKKKETVAIEIVDGETGLVVRSIDVRGKSADAIDRIDTGANINLNHDRYFTRRKEA